MSQLQIRGSTQIIAGSVTAALLASGVAAANLGFTPLNPANNLSDLNNAGTARGNLGLTSAAVTPIGTSGAVLPLLNAANTWGAAQTMSAGLNMGSASLTGLAAPSGSTDAVTKSYVDSAINGLTIHNAHAMQATNVASLSGTPTMDGVTLTAGQIVLLTGQTTASQNGLWTVAAGAWTRPAMWAAASSQKEGAYVWLDPDGTTYGSTKWRCTNTGTITIDTTSTTWGQDLSGSSYTNGSGLSLTGGQFAVKYGNGVAADGSNNITLTPDPNRLLQVVSAGVGIKDGTPGQIVMANASGNAAYLAMSGDATISSAGAVTINNTAGSGFLKYANVIANEVMTGTINGSNVTFTTANTPYGLSLYLNGIMLRPGAGNDYTISGNTITMLYAPTTGDLLVADYFK